MQIKLPRDTYSGVDGTSLSDIRCSQIVVVYEMINNLGTKLISYLKIQEEAKRQKIFGTTNAKSAIRTIFPLLKKLGFVKYEGEFPANRCFTKLGVEFTLACRALLNVNADTPCKDEIVYRLQNIKRNAQIRGLINMYNDPEWESHNIWVALKLLKEFRIIHWNYFLFTLYFIDSGKTINESINYIGANRRKIEKIDFVNENGEPLPNTCYSYIRSFLKESGLISNVTTKSSKLLEEADVFFTQINM